ncbi:transmembrane protein, putative (macronuclear) [Tetrahymena thermophila SB210]|uniref:Transmembrane protein, putative n=1 Tax=Tetrahymena thermophila (strain SB210) TaxID=312017 RepID=I7MFJ7_TETTS|nr:transmembrane protein, putative [Tetrahymena thermophila SB210]EAR84011.2 transmembrane protein, putative [Tetrahymena thermophila SB210]|eukprot:XP_001031674.2 transmembrane protein, putative [Tetrahymena thermophila SB210]
MKITQEVSNILGFEKSDLIGKEIEAIIPEQYQKYHHIFLKNFIEHGFSSQLQKDKLFQFAINSKGFLVPIDLRIKIDHFSSQDYGVSGLMTKISQMTEYILLTDDFCISNMTEKLYRQCFQFQFKDEYHRIKNIDILRIIPLIGALNFKQSSNLINGKTVNTIMLIPLSKTIMEQLTRKSGHPETELSLLLCKIFIHKYAFFEISADVKKIESSIGKSFYYIQFRQIRRIGRVSEKIDQFNDLKKDLNRLLGLDLKMTQVDSDQVGKKSNNPFTKTYFYQNGRTFLSNTITNSSIVESTYFKSFATSQYDDDDDNDSQYVSDYKVSHQSLRQTHSQFKSQVVEEIKEGQAEEEDEEDTQVLNKYSQTNMNNNLESNQLTKSSSKFTSQFGVNQSKSFGIKQKTGLINKMTSSINTDDMNNSSLFYSASQQQFQDISFINNQKMDETKEFFQTQRGPLTENDNLITTSRNEYQGLITRDNNNISSISNNEIDQTNREIEDYSHNNLSDNQIFSTTQRNPLIDNNQFNDVSFAAYENKTDNDIQHEGFNDTRLNSSESKSNEDQFQIDSNHQQSDQNINSKFNLPSSSASKSSMNSSIQKRSQFSPYKSKDDIIKLNSMKSSVASYRLNTSMKQSIRTQENSRRKRMSRLFKKVLRQVKNSMFWIKKLKQQYYFQDENERELAVLRVDGILIKDESERGGDNTKTAKQKIQTQAVLSDSDFEEDEFESPRKLQSMKSLNRRKTKQKVPILANIKNKKKKTSAGGSSSQQQSALQNYNVKKKIIKLIKNKKSTLSIKLIKLFWIVSLLCISFVTFLSFIFNKNNYDTYIANIQEQRLIIEIIESTFQIISNREYEVLATQTPSKIYPFITLPDQNLLQKYSNDTTSKLEIIKTDFQQIVDRYNSHNLNYLLANNMTINEYFDRGPISFNQSIYYTLRNFLLMIFQYAIIRVNSSDVINNILTNYYQFYTEFSSYLTESYNLSQQSLSDTISFMYMTMILVFSVSLGNIISMSPIYYYNQVKIEEFLKLFSTFPKDKIESMIEIYEESFIFVSNLQSGFKQEKNQDFNFNQEIKYKKRSISNTTNFSKMKIWIIIIQLLSFCLFSIYPFVKYIYGYQTYDYFNYGSSELYIFGKSTFLWSASQGLLYANTNLFLQNQSNKASSTLQDFMNKLIQDNQSLINDFYSLQGQFNQKRWYQGQFNSIILNSFQKDACSSVYNNLSFLTTSQQVNTQKSSLDECNQMNNSIFTNGIMFVLKNYFSIIQEVWSDLFINQQVMNTFVQIYRSLDSKYDFNTIQESYLVFEAILGAVLDASLNILLGISSQLYQIEINLFVYASIVIFLIFGIGWYYFIRKLQSSLNQAKQILCLMSFESIIENPYIMSYVSKNTQLDV